jgi:hypothetical protein
MGERFRMAYERRGALIRSGNLITENAIGSRNFEDIAQVIRAGAEDGTPDDCFGFERYRRYDEADVHGELVKWTCPTDPLNTENTLYELSGIYNADENPVRSYKNLRSIKYLDLMASELVRCSTDTVSYARFVQDTTHVNLHTIHYKPGRDFPAMPTPPRPHKDGVVWTMLVLISQENVISPDMDFFIDSNIDERESVREMDDQHILTISLHKVFDYVVWNDHHLFHDVGAITVSDHKNAGSRTILIADFS